MEMDEIVTNLSAGALLSRSAELTAEQCVALWELISACDYTLRDFALAARNCPCGGQKGCGSVAMNVAARAIVAGRLGSGCTLAPEIADRLLEILLMIGAVDALDGVVMAEDRPELTLH